MKNYSTLLLLAISCSLAIVSCKKEEDPKDNAKLDEQTEQFNEDANNYKGESDQADNDINNALDSIPGFGKMAGTLSSTICGCEIDDTSQIGNKIVFFNFDGITPCLSPSRTRAGTIKVQLTSGNLWSDAGSVLTITYINYKVVRLSDNKSIEFNGVKTLKNINGHDWFNFILGLTTFKYQERALNIDVTFDNNQSAVWNSARTTEWSYQLATAKITFTANGDSTINGYSNVDSWGVNRFSQAFTTNYTTPWVSNTYCGLWRPSGGELVHHVNSVDFTLTLGVNTNGTPSTLACAYGYKVTWTAGGTSNSLVFSY